MAGKDRDWELWQDHIEDKDGAFECLYMAFVDRLYAYGCRVCDNPDLVQDAIQDIFLRIYRRDGLDRIQNVRSYLFVSLRNYVRSHRRRSLRQERRHETYTEMLEVQAEPPQDGAKQAALRANLRHLIDQLPERQREILYLKYFEGLDYEEIESVMGISYQVARNYLYRAIKHLRRHLEGEPRWLDRWRAS